MAHDIDPERAFHHELPRDVVEQALIIARVVGPSTDGGRRVTLERLREARLAAQELDRRLLRLLVEVTTLPGSS